MLPRVTCTCGALSFSLENQQYGFSSEWQKLHQTPGKSTFPGTLLFTYLGSANNAPVVTSSSLSERVELSKSPILGLETLPGELFAKISLLNPNALSKIEIFCKKVGDYYLGSGKGLHPHYHYHHLILSHPVKSHVSYYVRFNRITKKLEILCSVWWIAI